MPCTLALCYTSITTSGVSCRVGGRTFLSYIFLFLYSFECFLSLGSARRILPLYLL